jgi:hypothetical protein
MTTAGVMIISASVAGGMELIVGKPEPCGPEVHSRVRSLYCKGCGSKVNGYRADEAVVPIIPNCALSHAHPSHDRFCPDCGMDLASLPKRPVEKVA